MKPGVYIMMDKTGLVIYVGKAKQLKNRVSQYFQDSASHTQKTLNMVSQVAAFDVIIANSEFEALVLECSLIKRHKPKYNILLKDSKGYPFIRVDFTEDYPALELVQSIKNDGARYFGPYGGRHVTFGVIDALRDALMLPVCGRKFTEKGRSCLNYHIKKCRGYCRGDIPREEYVKSMEQAALIMEGRQDKLAAGLTDEMNRAAEELNFELAAMLRDRIAAITKLSERQRVVLRSMVDTDVVGYYGGESKSCFTVLHFINGQLLDKDYEIVESKLDISESEAVSSLLKQYYITKEQLPKIILLPCEIEDSELFAQMLRGKSGFKTELVVPQRGEKAQLVKMARLNAEEETLRATTKEEREIKTLALLQKMLGMEKPPRRIEAYDISNTSGSDITASMTVHMDLKPLKRAYRRFKIKTLDGQDDYGAMNETLARRFKRYLDGDEKFAELPDIILVDGGYAHVTTARRALGELGLDIPTFGMVKDDRHRTRALIDAEGGEISVASNQSVFSFIGRIQEETHRFAIEYHQKLRSKSVKGSSLDNIKGVGPSRRSALFKHFGSIGAIKRAAVAELCAVVPENVAKLVFEYFNDGENAK